MGRFGVGLVSALGAILGLGAGMMAGSVVAEHQSLTSEEEAYWRLGLAIGGAALGAGLLAGASAPKPVAQVAQSSTTTTTTTGA